MPELFGRYVQRRFQRLVCYLRCRKVLRISRDQLYSLRYRKRCFLGIFEVRLLRGWQVRFFFYKQLRVLLIFDVFYGGNDRLHFLQRRHLLKRLRRYCVQLLHRGKSPQI